MRSSFCRKPGCVRILCIIVSLFLLHIPAGFAQTHSWDISDDASAVMKHFSPPSYSKKVLKESPYLFVVKVAQSQIGYSEKANGSVKYTALFPGTEGGWCTEFLAWCAVQAGTKAGVSDMAGTVYPFVDNATEAARFFALQGRYIGADGRDLDKHPQWLFDAAQYMRQHEYVPYPGDVIFLNYYGSSSLTDHVALVEGTSTDSNKKVWVHVIEGNMGGKVRRNAYRLGDARVVGYGTPVKRAYTQLGSNSQYGGIAQLEDALRTLGYYEGKTKTILNGPLLKALKAFKKDSGLKNDNRVDIATQQMINKRLTEKAQDMQAE